MTENLKGPSKEYEVSDVGFKKAWRFKFFEMLLRVYRKNIEQFIFGNIAVIT